MPEARENVGDKAVLGLSLRLIGWERWCEFSRTIRAH